MRTGAARGQAGHFHEAGFYGCDAEFRALIVPFAEEGIGAGEPVIIGYDDRKSALLRSWLSDPSAVEFIEDASLYAKPARAIKIYRRLCFSCRRSGGRPAGLAEVWIALRLGRARPAVPGPGSASRRGV
jgi:hypothetical protein